MCPPLNLPVLGAGDGLPPPLPLHGGEGGAGREGRKAMILKTDPRNTREQSYSAWDASYQVVHEDQGSSLLFLVLMFMRRLI